MASKKKADHNTKFAAKNPTPSNGTPARVVVSPTAAVARPKTAPPTLAQSPLASAAAAPEAPPSSAVRVSDSPPSSRPASGPRDDDAVRAKIAEVAYLRWLDRGCAPGHATEDWLAAEREVRGEAG